MLTFCLIDMAWKIIEEVEKYQKANQTIQEKQFCFKRDN